MATYAVTTAKGPNWDASRGIREQPSWEQHAAFADGLVDEGFIVLGGPIDARGEEDVALLVIDAPDEEQVRSRFDEDPWVVSGVLQIKDVRSWTLWLDGRQPATAG